MEENHQDKIESKTSVTEERLWLPSSVSKDQEMVVHLGKVTLLKAIYKWTGFSGKTLWDWLQLLGVLAIPLMVVGVTIAFSIQQANLADAQHQQEQANALDQQRAAILQTYIDNIQDLLLHEHLGSSQPNIEVSILARARTLAALKQLDPIRKGFLVEFLYEAHLIGFIDNNGQPHSSYITLSGAVLVFANLSFANLSSAEKMTQEQLDQVYTCRNAELPGTLICNRFS